MKRWAAVAAATAIIAIAVFAVASQGGGAQIRPGEPVGPVAAMTPAPAAAQASEPRAVESVDAARRSRLRRAAERAVQDAHALEGTAEIAVWEEGIGEPVIEGDDVDRTMRMWSISKLVTALATLDAARRVSSQSASGTLRDAIMDAVRQSNNCAQRRVVLGLQELAGGVSGARAAFREVLSRAGVRLGPNPQSGGEISDYCRRYLAERAGVGDPFGRTALFGVQRWTIEDMMRFARALAEGRYGRSGSEVLEDMRRPKLPSEETPPGDFTAAPDWGAGQAFASDDVAYKAGWGGYDHADGYVASQLVIAGDADRPLVVVAAFHPDVQPPDDDPGKTAAPQAMTEMLGRVAEGAEG